MTTSKKRQHYVWRDYLGAWSIDGRLFCLADDKIIHVNPRHIAVEKYFYKLNNLTQQDVAFLEAFIAQFPTEAQETLTGFIKMFTIWHRLQELPIVQRNMNDEVSELINIQLVNAEEDYHAGIEAAALPIMHDLRRGNIGRLENEEICMNFCYFLAVQLFRTKGIKTRFIERTRHNTIYNAENCWNIMSHVMAANLGFSLFSRRNANPFRMLKNDTNFPFITSDQPVVNLLGSRQSGLAPQHLAIFYPLSPRYALFMDDADNPQGLANSSLSEEAVNRLNTKMADASHTQIFCDNADLLKSFKNSRHLSECP